MDREKIIKQMEGVVSTFMRNPSDFEKYDRATIYESHRTDFPIFWIVNNNSTYLIKLGWYVSGITLGKEEYIYDWVSGSPYPDMYLAYVETNSQFYLITENGIKKTSIQAYKETVRDLITPAVAKYIKEHGNLPKPKVKVKFRGITLSKLKELINDCRKHNDDSLLKCLKRFHRYNQSVADHYISVCYDSRYNEFGFTEMINGKSHLVGGIIFHGWKETGYFQNNSVQLTPQYGWASHT